MATGLVLSDDERKRFIYWLDNFAMSSDQLASNIALHLPEGIKEQILKKYRTEALVCRAVQKILENTETMSIG